MGLFGVAGWTYSEQYRLECEARYWLAKIKNVWVVELAGEHEITVGHVQDVTRDFIKRIIKKRGEKAARALFGEMVKQWQQQKEWSLIHTVYGGAKSLESTLQQGIT